MPSCRTLRLPAIVSLAAVIAGLAPEARAQNTPSPQPSWAPPAAYPQATPYPQGYVAQQVPGAPRPNPLRELFAGTIAAVLQGAGGALVSGVTGSIANWFDRKQRKAGLVPQPVYGTPAYPSAQSAQSGPAYPAAPDPNAGVYQTSPYSADPYGTNAPAYPGSSSAGNPYATQPQGYDWSTTQVYDPRTGQASFAQAADYSLATAQGANATSIVAGGAYDVLAIGAGGVEGYVNAATHEFHTGDRFRVSFRPTLPGRLDIYNINPYGRETQIDSVEMAAGQLTTLGPYEFAATRGDEALRFVMTPCGTEQLLASTRDIVNVGPGVTADYSTAAPASGGVSLQNCGAPTTRSVGQVKTRDIQKVGVDGTTSFALDPVSQVEMASGQLAPREFTVYFHHR